MHLLFSATLLSASAMPLMAADPVNETWTVGSDSWDVELTSEDLCPGVKYTVVNWKTNRSTTRPGSRLHVIEADLTNPKVSIEAVKNPGTLYGTNTLINHAKRVHTSSHQVVAGANANFWENTSGSNFQGAYGGAGCHGVSVADGIMYADPNIASVAHVGGPITTTGLLAVDADGKVYMDFLKEQIPYNFGTADNPIWAIDNGAGSGSEFSCFNKSIGHQMQLDMCNRFVPYSCASCFTKEWGRDRQFNVGDLGTKFVKNAGFPGTDNALLDDPSKGQIPFYTEVLLDFADGTTEFNIGGKTPMVIKEIRSYTTGQTPVVGTLGDHDLAVVGRGAFGSVTAGAWKVGHEVDFNTTLNFVDHGTPGKIMSAVSGNIMAMKNGEIQPLTTSTTGLGQGGYDNTMYPRTIYGVNADRTKFYILVCEHNVKNPTTDPAEYDKYPKIYQGFSTSQMCTMARDHFNVSNAIQVDCGGSSYMYAKGYNVAKSYDGSGQRAVYNGMFVCYNGDDVKLPEPGAVTDPDVPVVVDPDEGWTDSGERAHFAYGLYASTDDRGIPTANYYLTGDVKAVEVILTNRDNDADVVTLTGCGNKAGLNTVYVDNEALTTGASYDWKVRVLSNPVSGTSHFFHEAPAKLDARGGVGIVTDPESDAYGKIITSVGYAQGFNLYNPDLTKVGNYHAGMAPLNAGNRSDFFKIGMRDRNTAYACCWSDAGSGFWKFDPTSPETTPTNLSAGTNDGTGCFMVDGNCTGSGAPGIAFQGTGKDTRFWAFAEDWKVNGGDKFKGGILARWDIGVNEQITGFVSAAYSQYTGASPFVNTNVCITPTPDGVFCAQVRGPGNNSTGVPGFIYTNIYGDMIYNSGEHQGTFNSCGGSIAISEDLTIAAVAGNTEHIKIYDVTWEDKVLSDRTVKAPVFKLRAYVNDTKHVTEVSQLAFDPANNLYAWQRSTNGTYAGLFGYSWKNDAPEATTPAKANSFIVAPKYTGIDDIVTDGDADSNATPVYYTIQGVRVDAANLTPGLYIKVTGRTTEKVIIK